jgi:hypothetical protein
VEFNTNPFNPESIQLSLNSMDSQVTRETLKQTVKMIMYSIVYNSSKTTDFADDEKFLIGIMAYDRISKSIDAKEPMLTAMEVYVDSFVSLASDLYTRQRRTDTARMKAMLKIIDDKDYQLEDLPQIGDNHIKVILETTIDQRFDQSYTDEVFSMSMFMTEDNVIMSANKLQNIRSLYNTIIYPILMYYKVKTNQVGINLLNIASGFSNSNKLQQRGFAVEFNLEGIDSSTIFKDIQEGRISIRFGVLKKATPNLFISLPYTTDEGKYIEDLIEE